MPMSETIATLRAELADAFADREHPGDERVAHSRPGCDGYEGHEAREWLQGKSWRDVLSEGAGIEHRDYLHFLSPEGWLYYFPAFATLALDIEHPAEMDETLVIKLGSFPEDVVALLTPPERRAVIHFLEYLADAYDRRGDVINEARLALETHWAQVTDDGTFGDDKPTSNGTGPARPAADPQPPQQENGDALS